jgi:hypothetical protein
VDDVQPRWNRVGHRSLPTGETRSTRPGRPPSRRDRPRAAGTSAPPAASSRDAAARRACVMNRTYVRRIGLPPDGMYTNRCLCVLCAVIRSMKWLNHAGLSLQSMQRELQGDLCFKLRRVARAMDLERAMPPRAQASLSLDGSASEGPLCAEHRFYKASSRRFSAADGACLVGRSHWHWPMPTRVQHHVREMHVSRHSLMSSCP